MWCHCSVFISCTISLATLQNKKTWNEQGSRWEKYRVAEGEKKLLFESQFEWKYQQEFAEWMNRKWNNSRLKNGFQLRGLLTMICRLLSFSYLNSHCEIPNSLECFLNIFAIFFTCLCWEYFFYSNANFKDFLLSFSNKGSFWIFNFSEFSLKVLNMNRIMIKGAKEEAQRHDD